MSSHDHIYVNTANPDEFPGPRTPSFGVGSFTAPPQSYSKVLLNVRESKTLFIVCKDAIVGVYKDAILYVYKTLSSISKRVLTFWDGVSIKP